LGVVKTIRLDGYPRTAYPVDLTTGDGFVCVAVHWADLAASG
jgi:hypothetical protein